MLEGLGATEREKIWLDCGQWPRVGLELGAKQALEASLVSTESPEILESHSSPPQVVPLGPIHYTQSRGLKTDSGLLFWRALVFLSPDGKQRWMQWRKKAHGASFQTSGSGGLPGSTACFLSGKGTC